MELFKQIPLYRFLALCNESGMEKTILDCGAGGDSPPLSLFADYGYNTHGIEMNNRLKFYDEMKTNKLDTSDRTIEEIVDRIKNIIQ